MKQADAGARLDSEQSAAADTGAKAMIPVGRPFLDYALSAMADAGFTEICLVIGPEHNAIRRHYTKAPRPTRLKIGFAIQEKPLGTADAVLAAERFVGGDHFAVVNSDNLYPPSALKTLVHMGGAGLPVFKRSTLVQLSNIPEERVRQFAVAAVSRDGFLQHILEKPDEATLAAQGDDPWISMNCWRFSPGIFQACRESEVSPRGELELPRAVEYAIVTLGQRFRAVPCKEGVLDLSTRADIEPVTAFFKGIEVLL
jgi:dTDP-glucose pyrophosphorylase